MMGFISLEVYIFIFNIKPLSYKFKLYMENFDEVHLKN